jgi:K+-sensing histidine kinase KdpD
MSPGRVHSRCQTLAVDCTVAVLTVAATGVGAVGFHHLSGIVPSASLFSCAVMLVAWSRGIAPAMLATALAIMVFDYFFLEPRFTLAVQTHDLPQLIFFAIGALLVSLMCHSERKSKRALQEFRAKSFATEARVAELERELALLANGAAAFEAPPAGNLAQSALHRKSGERLSALEVKVST